MNTHTTLYRGIRLGAVAALTVVALLLGIHQAGCADKKKKTVEIRAKGSDTLIQLATAWAEAYRKVKPNVFVNASGGGTGTGIAALQNNTTDRKSTRLNSSH